MLARLQQAITLGLITATVFWAVRWWPTSPSIALLPFGLVVLVYIAFFAIEFVAIKIVNAADPAPPAGWSMLARAWLHEVLTAPTVFCWRQPFRANAIPDSLPPASGLPPRRGVVFVHGFFCNRGFWTPWLERLRALGQPFVAVNLEPVFGSIDDYAPQIEAAVQRLTQATGCAPVLVCHSMGGLAARAWLRAGEADHQIHRVVTIGTPHGGTWLGRFSFVLNGQQMRLAGEWVTQLVDGEPAGRSANFTCWYSNCDNIVFPATTATLPGAANRFVPGEAHVALAFCPQVMDATLDSLQTDHW
jgi:pimeloyl-ACP methyl ester carboxylesterase